MKHEFQALQLIFKMLCAHLETTQNENNFDVIQEKEKNEIQFG